MIKLCLLTLSPARLALLKCLLACWLACLLDNLINPFIWWLWRVWNLYLNRFPKSYCCPVFTPIFCIGTVSCIPVAVPLSCICMDPLISVPFSYIMIYDNDIYSAYLHDVLSPACDHLTTTYYLLTWHYLTFDIWSPDAWYLTLIIITIREWWPDILTYLDIFQYKPYSWYIMHSWYTSHTPSHFCILIII